MHRFALVVSCLWLQWCWAGACAGAGARAGGCGFLGIFLSTVPPISEGTPLPTM